MDRRGTDDGMEETLGQSFNRLVEQVDEAWNTYDKNRAYREARYDLRNLRELAQAATVLADAISAHGLPPPRHSSASDADQRLARQGHRWAKRLSGCSDVLLNGDGDSLIQSPITLRPFEVNTDGHKAQTNIRTLLSAMVGLLNDSDLHGKLDELHCRERVLQLKANLLTCFDYCKRRYNREKPRKPRSRASDEVHEEYLENVSKAKERVRNVFDRLLPAAIPFPLTETIQQTARDELDRVLMDKGQQGRAQSSEAVVPVVQAVVRKYLQRHVGSDLVRQGASLASPRMRPSAEVLSAVARETEEEEQPQNVSKLQKDAVEALKKQQQEKQRRAERQREKQKAEERQRAHRRPVPLARTAKDRSRVAVQKPIRKRGIQPD